MKVSFGRRGFAVAITLAMIGSGAAIGLAAAGATSAPSGQAGADAGILRLHLSNSGSSVSYSGPLAVSPQQPITISASCGVTTAGSLLQFTPTGATQGLGLVSNGLGVRTKDNCAADSGRISAGQTVTVALGSAFGSNVRVATAELDIEGKHSASLGTALNGGPIVTRQLKNSSDNGPDSGVRDNDRVVIPESFRSITLSPVGGEVSLEGGGDGTYAQYLAAGDVGLIGQQLQTADTIFKLVQDFDHAVDCLDPSVNATVIGGSATSAKFDRLLNYGATSPNDCEDIGVTLQILDVGVRLDKSTAGLQTGAPQAVNARVQIVWKPQTAQVPLPPRQIAIDPALVVFNNVQWCTGIDATGRVIHPPNVPWCLISDHAELQADGKVQQTQIYDGAGDPMWR
jgi:hypothetical protein